MKIYSYSERGIINSLLYNIGYDCNLLKQFIELISLPNQINIGNPINYTILIEQSFSDFGDSDFIIILHYENPKDQKVIFFEAKVKTLQGNWIINNEFNKFNTRSTYNGYSSNLFFQLYLKKLLFDNWEVINNNINNNNNNNFSIIDSYSKNRKIGQNGVVLKAFDMICGSEAHYIGLVPTKDNDITKFQDNNYTEIHFLSWETVHNFCINNKLDKVLEIFDYNYGQIY